MITKITAAQKVQLAPKIKTIENITSKTIENAMTKFYGREERFATLYRYYIGCMDFPEELQNNIVANFCAYIVKAVKGYMTGNPPQFGCAKDDTYGQAIIDLMRTQNAWKIIKEALEDLSIYGRSFILVYHSNDEQATPKSVVLSPADAFVAYAGDVESDSIFGAVRYEEVLDDESKLYKLDLYTRQDVQRWTATNRNGPWSPQGEPVLHRFGRVPLIEISNNREYMGDFEQILDLQDAYNYLLSDRQDDKDAFAQSMLKVKGMIISTNDEEEARLNKMKLKKGRILQMDEDADAEYLVKTMDETGVQVLQDSYKNDIHKFGMVPDLSDEQFAANASGVAMSYKLFGTDQLVADKEAQFQAAFTRWCKLYDAALSNSMRSPTYTPMANIAEMTIHFNLNAPQDVQYLATALTTLTGGKTLLSRRTAMENIEYIDDVNAELDELKKEEGEEDTRAQALAGDQLFAGQQKLNNEQPSAGGEEEQDDE